MGTGNPMEDLDQFIERHHLALGEFVKGDFEPLKELFSEREDVTLGNPFGPFVRGHSQVVETMKRAATNYRDGEATGFETITKHVTRDLACVVEVERFEAKVGGSDTVVPLSLRVTNIFRLEEGGWRVIHRHADPITNARPPESLLQDR